MPWRKQEETEKCPLKITGIIAFKALAFSPRSNFLVPFFCHGNNSLFLFWRQRWKSFPCRHIFLPIRHHFFLNFCSHPPKKCLVTLWTAPALRTQWEFLFVSLRQEHPSIEARTNKSYEITPCGTIWRLRFPICFLGNLNSFFKVVMFSYEMVLPSIFLKYRYILQLWRLPLVAVHNFPE